MLIIPAIDILNRYCVRLKQGKLEEETIYSRDPVFIAKLWAQEGAKRIHVTDLDGAFTGKLQNFDIIEQIRKSLSPEIEIEVGGGIRDKETAAKLISIGINKIVIGTIAVYNVALLEELLSLYPGKVILSLDIRNGMVSIGGWKETTPLPVEEFCEKIKKFNIREIIYTDIERDGTLEGLNFKNIEKMCSIVECGIIIAGGIKSIEDIKKLKKYEPKVKGAIIGKALYTQNINLREAISVAERGE
jgi:phosphoribosylformimino-5-aminoimidazole carboxamide ribotide isomerase